MRVRSRRLVAPLLPVGLSLALFVSLAFAGGVPVGQRLVLSLGDSIATGTQPDADGKRHGTAQGYGNVLAQQLGRELTVLGRGGATTASMLGTGQEANAVDFLRQHQGDDAIVTIAIGANDVERCSDGGAFPSSCVDRALRAVAANLPAIVRQLQAAAGPHVTLVGLTYYDSFLASWLDGARGRAVVARAVRVERSMNAAIARGYRAAGVRVADVAGAFASEDLAHLVTAGGYARLPRAVSRVCRWTWACRAPHDVSDDHPNAMGYRVIARAILRALPASLQSSG